MQHALTVDVEDFECLAIRRRTGLSIEPRNAVVRHTYYLLDLFSEFNTKATFFFLGEVAKAYPTLVKTVSGDGHEIAVHGYSHQRFFDMTPKQAFNEVYSAKSLLEDIIGAKVKGHRAPAFSICPNTAWAFKVLLMAGFQYDSSVMPFAGRRYGWPGFDNRIQRLFFDNHASIIEAPMPVANILGFRFPVGGGGYLRHFPYMFTRWSLKGICKVQPIITYVHPYDIDTTSSFYTLQNEIRLRRSKQKVHLWLQFRNRYTVREKLKMLLTHFKFTTLSEVIYRSPLEDRVTVSAT